MPREGGGIYSPTEGNPVVPGTVIESDWANPLVTDLGNEITDSLSRSGKGGMLAPLRGLDGSAALPTFSFTTEPSTGRYRDGPGRIVESVQGKPVVRYLASGLEQWDDDINDWVPLTPRDALGTPFDPSLTNLTSTNVQDAIDEVNAKVGGAITADSVTYDDTNVYFPATTVQHALDRIGADIPLLANDIADNRDNIAINSSDILLLESRITSVEITAGNNAVDIGALDTRVTNNSNSISLIQADISSIKLEQQTQNSNIQKNATDILSVYNITQTNADNISTNVNAINQNAADIQTNYTLHTIMYGWFPGDVLDVAHGGTGVSASTGDTSVVLSNGPTLTSPTLNNAALYTPGIVDANMYGTTSIDANGALLTPTVAAGDNSVNAASTAWVRRYAAASYGNASVIFGANSSGYYSGYVNTTDPNAQWVVVMWYEKVCGHAPGTIVYLPLTTNFQDYSVSTQALVAGNIGIDTSPGVTNRQRGQFNCTNNNWATNWIVTGRADYSGAFAELPVSSNRFYNKLHRTEHIEQIHGPWTDDPNVVILPPGNAFWGAPLGLDEELTFDGDGLPLARVARAIPLSETIGELLRNAGLTQLRLSKALYAAQRGIGTDLASFNADMDALVAAEPYTLEQFIEYM